MRFQTDRCVQCGSPERPTNLRSNYGFLQDGSFPGTGYWVCSDECYLDIFCDTLENKDYLPKYSVEFVRLGPDWNDVNLDKLPPSVARQIEKLHRDFMDQHEWGPDGLRINTGGKWFLSADEVKRRKIEILRAWKQGNLEAIHTTTTKIFGRVRAEWAKELAKRAEEEESKRQKEQAILERERGRMEEKARREEYQRQRDEERAEERRQREAERRQRELEKIQREEDERERARLEEEARIDAMRPRPIPPIARLSHTHVLGATGAGKTTLIIKHVQEDMDAGSTVIVIDPKGTLVDRLSRHQHFGVDWNIYDRILDENEEKGITDFDVVGVTPLVLIDPSMFVPALNMFAKPKRKYSPAFAQRMENLTVSLFQYIFASKESSLTDKQLTCFSYSVKLLLSMPRANIRTLLDLLEDPCVPRVGGIRNESYFKPYIDALDDISRRFFYRNFYDASDYTATKDQIATRIHGMLRYPAFADMFLTYENKIDMFDYLRGNKVVLISSPVAVLGTEGSQLFSRYMMSLVLQAALERTTIDRHWWHPAYLYIDEAQLVMDEVKTQELLQLAREFKLGVTLLHHQIEGEISQKIFSTLSANTRIKYASTPAAADARIMAMDMRCEPQFIMDRMPHEHDTHGSFACFCSGVTPHPFIYELDFVEDNSFPELPDDEYRILCQYQKETYGVRKRGPEQEPHSESSRFQTTNEPPGHSPQEEFDTENVSTSKPQPPRQQANTSSIGSTHKIDPHTGDHTEPSEKWGDDH